MANLSVFQFNQSSNVRTFADNKGEYWFLANDVCDILGYVNARDAIAKHCRINGVAKRYTITETRGNQEMTYINEPNLYRLIIKSRKPEAEAFEEWVMEEVLPTIRKTGSYSNPQYGNDYLNDWEQEQIRQAVKARSLRTGETTQAIYTKLHAYMGCDSYMNICQCDFQTALNFLASIENAPTLFTQTSPMLSDHEISRFAVVTYYLDMATKQLKDFSEPLKELGANKEGVAAWTIWDESQSWIRHCQETLSRLQPSMTEQSFKEQVQNCLQRI